MQDLFLENDENDIIEFEKDFLPEDEQAEKIVLTSKKSKKTIKELVQEDQKNQSESDEIELEGIEADSSSEEDTFGQKRKKEVGEGDSRQGSKRKKD